MNRLVTGSTGRLQTTARWVARLAGVASLGIIVWLAIAERMNPLQMRLEDLVLFFCYPGVIMTGLLVGWRWEFLGGALTLGGCAAYLGAHRFLVGVFPPSWPVLACAIPGLLFLMSSLLARLHAQRSMDGSPGAG